MLPYVFLIGALCGAAISEDNVKEALPNVDSYPWKVSVRYLERTDLFLKN